MRSGRTRRDLNCDESPSVTEKETAALRVDRLACLFFAHFDQRREFHVTNLRPWQSHLRTHAPIKTQERARKEICMEEKFGDDIKDLIDTGKDKGYLTYGEVNDMVPEDMCTAAA